jgi:AraC-like DNA-binding protein
MIYTTSCNSVGCHVKLNANHPVNLLIGADLNVAQIAYRLGFENPPYFSRLFEKETGLSPVAYRNQY